LKKLKSVTSFLLIFTFLFSIFLVKFPENKALANRDNPVNVVVAFDENYKYPALVCLESMLKNADSNTFYNIYCLVPGEFQELNKSIFLNLKNKYNNFEIVFKDMKDAYNDSRTHFHLSKVAYYRLKIPEVLQDLEKCIYIDTDTLVLKDLTELFNINIHDNYIGAANDGPAQRCEDLNFLDRTVTRRDQYVNSGVLLWNLKKCREDNLCRRFEEFLTRFPEPCYLDQTAINEVCYNKIFEIPARYNMTTFYDITKSWSSYDYIQRAYRKYDWEDGRMNMTILHYSAPDKPWKNGKTSFFEKWWQYAKKTSVFQEIKNKYLHNFSPSDKIKIFQSLAEDESAKKLKVKIMVSHHKPTGFLKDRTVFVPIHVGRALNANVPTRQGMGERGDAIGEKNKIWMTSNMIGDDTGQNISLKNRTYCEMCAVYWAFKNQWKLGNPDYIGNFHYRRHLSFLKSQESDHFLTEYVSEEYQNEHGLNAEQIKKVVKNYDLILNRIALANVRYNFTRTCKQPEKNLDIALEVIRTKFPEYYSSAQNVLSSGKIHYCNMFIMKKEIFNEYCNFIFGVIEEVEKNTDLNSGLMGQAGYLSEVLSEFFYRHQAEKNKKILELSDIFITNPEKGINWNICPEGVLKEGEKEMIWLEEPVTLKVKKWWQEARCSSSWNEIRLKYLNSLSHKEKLKLWSILSS